MARSLLKAGLNAPSKGAPQEAATVVDDFDIAQSKIGESAQRVVDRAVEETRRRDHTMLTNEHIFLAFAQVEWDTFAQVMRDLELNPHEILQALEEHLQMLPAVSGLMATEILRLGRDTARIPVLAMSCRDPNALEAQQIGCNGYLPKPIQPDVLVHEVRRVLASTAEV